MSKLFKKFVIKAELNNSLRFHDLRHSFASFLAQSGVSLYVISKLLGHSDIKTTEIYAHLTPNNYLNAVEMLDDNPLEVATTQA
jgi:site-specific recombinase XerD